MLIFDLIRPLVRPIAAALPAAPLDVNRITVPVPDLPPSLQGFTIVQISDLHVGEDGWEPGHIDAAAEVIRRASPNLVVNTGDFLEKVASPGHVRAVAARLSLPDPDRNFAVLGNHDYADESDTPGLKRELDEAGIRVLENELVCLCPDEGGLSLAGLAPEAPGWHEAVRALGEAGHPRVVLLHTPDCAERLPWGIADLILSGHTHGGQIALPGLEAQTVRAFCGSRFVSGMHTVNGSPVYVNRGLGYAALPMRFRADPELTLITLAR